MKSCYPTQKQLDFLDWEMGAFFHFGIRTFYEGHRDWDGKEMPLSGFNPTALDCENWIKTIREAGFNYAILVCKHHDGFANWPSAYTSYSVANTPWKDGKGDVVREFTDACRKYGVKVGLYYSPAQMGYQAIADKDYDDYFINQISELLTNYGAINYLWFDGCGSEGHKYDEARIIHVIRTLQPGIRIFNMWDPDTRWVGNESGVAPSVNPYIRTDLDFSVQTKDKDVLTSARFLPAECDCRIRDDNWFFSDQDEDTVKSPELLMGLYDYSVGRGANLLINIAPDRRGLLPEKDAAAIKAFGEALRKRFANPIPAAVSQEENGYAADLGERPVAVNLAVLEEDLTASEEISHFEIWAHPYNYGDPIRVYAGDTVGHKAIASFPAFYTCRIEVRTDAKTLKKISLYFDR